MDLSDGVVLPSQSSPFIQRHCSWTNNCCVKKWYCKKSSARTLDVDKKQTLDKEVIIHEKKLDLVWEGQKSVLAWGLPIPTQRGQWDGSTYQWGQVGTTATLVPEGPDLIWRWWVRHNDHSVFHDNINTDGQQTEKRSGSQCRGLVQANNRLTDWLETY